MTLSETQIAIFMPLAVLVLLLIVAYAIHIHLFERRLGLTFSDAPWRSLLYFIAWSLIVIFLFPAQTGTLFAQATPTHYLFLAFMLLAVFPELYHATRMRDGSPDWLLTLSPGEGMLTLGERYIIAKIGDVVFQQLAASVVILTLAQSGIPYPAIVGISVALFTLAHLYIFRAAGAFWGLYYTTYAALSGFAFTFLILFIPAGIIYSILIHMLFYVLSGIIFAKLPRPDRRVTPASSGTRL